MTQELFIVSRDKKKDVMKMLLNQYLGPVLVFSAVGITASLGSNQMVEMLHSLPFMSDLLYLFSKLLPFLLGILLAVCLF